MELKTEEIISITAANQKFSNAMKIADKTPAIDLTDDEKIDIVAARILKRHKAAFLELAK